MKTQVESQSRSGKKSRGIRKLKRGLAPRLQEVDGQGALWKKKKSVETIVAMLTAKSKFLEKQVGCLSRENGEIGSLVT